MRPKVCRSLNTRLPHKLLLFIVQRNSDNNLLLHQQLFYSLSLPFNWRFAYLPQCLSLNFIYLKLFQRSNTADIRTKGHIRGQKQSLQLLTKIKGGIFVQNPEAHWLILTIFIHIHTGLSLLFLTPTRQNTCNSKSTQYTEALKYSSLRFSWQCQKLFHRHGVKSCCHKKK